MDDKQLNIILSNYFLAIHKWCEANNITRVFSVDAVDENQRNEIDSYFYSSDLFYISLTNEKNRTYEFIIKKIPKVQVTIAKIDHCTDSSYLYADTTYYKKEGEEAIDVIFSDLKDFMICHYFKNGDRFPSYQPTISRLYNIYLNHTINFFNELKSYMSVECISHNSLNEFFDDKSLSSCMNRDEIVCLNDNKVIISFSKTQNGGYTFSINYNDFHYDGTFEYDNFIEFRGAIRQFISKNKDSNYWVNKLDEAKLEYFTKCGMYVVTEL